MSAPLPALALVTDTALLSPKSTFDFWRFTSWDVPKELDAERFSADIVVTRCDFELVTVSGRDKVTAISVLNDSFRHFGYDFKVC